MVTNKPITKEYFLKRLADLCLKSGLDDFPKDETNLHILLKSAILMVDPLVPLTEKEVNAQLSAWVKDVGQMKNADHVSLRRRLVDAGYLIRSANGSFYQVSQSDPYPQLFNEAISQLDITKEIKAAREEIARRKREYLQKARSG